MSARARLDICAACVLAAGRTSPRPLVAARPAHQRGADTHAVERQRFAATFAAPRHRHARDGHRGKYSGGYNTIYPALKTMEDSGWVRRGMFVAGLGAAQFAMPAAVDMLAQPPHGSFGRGSAASFGHRSRQSLWVADSVAKN